MPGTVLIVDDHAGFRARARRALEAEGYDVVGEAGDGASALRAAARLDPQLVLLDVHLPDTTGFELARRFGAADVVLISTHDLDGYEEQLARSGARGFLPKAELSGPALEALRG